MPHSAHSREHGTVTIIGCNDDVQGKTKRGSRILGETLRGSGSVCSHPSVCVSSYDGREQKEKPYFLSGRSSHCFLMDSGGPVHPTPNNTTQTQTHRIRNSYI